MAHLTTYRYPSENITLVITLLVSTGIVIGLSTFTVGGAAVVALAGFAFTYATVQWRTWRLKKTALPASEVPDLQALVERCRERLGVKDPIHVCLVNANVLNAYAVGFRSRQSIVLYTGLIRALDRDELAYVIGHEMGHISFRHTTIHALTGQLGLHTFGVPVLGYLLRYLFFFWMRASEFSADRAGLIACGKLGSCLSTQLKLSVGPERGGRIDVTPIIEHWRQHNVAVTDQLKDVLSTHPGTKARMDKMVDFAFSGELRELERY